MKRYALFIRFKGTNFHGWQVQDNAKSIQAEIQAVLKLILQTDIELTGAGRTDAGVHATEMIAHFDAAKIDDLDLFLHKLNGVLDEDIAIFDIRETVADFHARFDAVSRTYHYQINFLKDPFVKEFSYYLKNQPDIEKMNQAALHLIGTKDFSCFSKAHTQTHTNDCEIIHASWALSEGVLAFEITANRFLRNMVRAIVGTLLEVGEGKRSVESITDLIASKDRSNAGTSVPAKGLFLSHIEYSESRFI
tara:strand:- start:8363 stop:9109 length:747 start_codon:yes stop_codon:yes gene_type:complete